MKKMILFAFLIGFWASLNASALPVLDMGFFFGLSTPSDKINDIYNTDLLEQEGVIGKFASGGVKSGFHVGVTARVPLSSGFVFRVGLAWHRFPETELKLTNPDLTIANNYAIITTTQDLFPVSVGVNYLFFDGTVFKAYGTGELAYYYFSNDADYSCTQMAEAFENVLDIDKSPTYNRVGFGIGAGCDVDLQVLKLNLEAKYNMSNLIGTETGEEVKDFFSLSLGLFI